MKNYYYSTDGTEVVGPYSLGDIRSLFEGGSLPRSTQVCVEGDEDWRPITSFLSVPLQPTQLTPTPPEPSKPDRRHIFYYVFWGTLSLLATIMILFLGFVFLTAAGSGFFKKPPQASSIDSNTSTSTNTKILPPLSVEEAADAEKLLKSLHVKRDDIEGITWYSPDEGTGYKTAVYLYIGKKQQEEPWLRLKIRYHGDGWLFVRRYRIKIDSEEPLTLLPTADVKRENNSGGVWEIFDEPATNHSQVINQILSSVQTYVRFEGTEGRQDFLLGADQLKAMRDVLLAYRYLGGRWPE